MNYSSGVFSKEFSDANSLYFFAAFHLGIPLALCQTHDGLGWEFVSSALEKAFHQNTGTFTVPEITYDPETRFPLGKQLCVAYTRFFNVFSVDGYIAKVNSVTANADCQVDHIIWICPSGVVLLIGRLLIRDACNEGFNAECFNSYIEQHYCELSYIFTEVAEVVYRTLQTQDIDSALGHSKAYTLCQKGIQARHEMLRTKTALKDSLQSEVSKYELFMDILIDVYFVETRTKENVFQDSGTLTEGFRGLKNANTEYMIGYTSSSLFSENLEYLYFIGISFSSFVSMLWIQQHLAEWSGFLQNNVIGRRSSPNYIISEIKIERIFFLQLIRGSSPISIRLKSKFMTCMEEFWEAERMHLLSAQIMEQIDTIENIVSWINDTTTELRNLKIGIAAVILSIISITSVAASLISTIDVYSQVGMRERVLFLIILSVFFSILSLLGVFLLPTFMITRKKRKRSNRKQTIQKKRTTSPSRFSSVSTSKRK